VIPWLFVVYLLAVIPVYRPINGKVNVKLATDFYAVEQVRLFSC